MFRIDWRQGLVAVLVVLAGCFTPKYPRAGEAIPLAADEALVFGRLRIIADGREVFMRRPDLLEELIGPPIPDVKPSIFHVEKNERAIYASLDEDGRFYWILPRGTHLVYVTHGDSVFTNVPVAAFQVAPGDQAVYVGTLTMRTSAGPNAARQPLDWELAGIGIADDFAVERAMLARRNPQFDRRVEKRVFVSDPELPDLFGDYSRHRCEQILARCGVHLLGAE
ncbi:MAG: hypothetical protein HYR85_06930 [Planctomycetes bacterium]|nr:hypothetical protein [Planctomycetota bacterium]MBI3843917.1 hypothetical protein [Planctomycetota bacterium]